MIEVFSNSFYLVQNFLTKQKDTGKDLVWLQWPWIQISSIGYPIFQPAVGNHMASSTLTPHNGYDLRPLRHGTWQNLISGLEREPYDNYTATRINQHPQPPERNCFLKLSSNSTFPVAWITEPAMDSWLRDKEFFYLFLLSNILTVDIKFEFLSFT